MRKSFLQSREWEQFQKALGRKTFWIEGILVIKFPLHLGYSYLYSPRAEASKKFFIAAKKIARQENAIFLRIDPVSHFTFHISRFRRATPLQPKQTILLNLRPSVKEILAQMKPKWRYNIRLALRHKIKIIKSTEPKDIEKFWPLALLTAKRDRFRYHPKTYYVKMLEVLGRKKMAKLYLAEYQGKIIAANIFLFTKETAVYLHGASLGEHRNLMAPHFLQWKAILEAKRKGCQWFDFWGIDEAKWPGITRFKMGFAPEGKIVNYPPAFIKVYQPFWYAIYSIFKRLKA